MTRFRKHDFCGELRGMEIFYFGKEKTEKRLVV